MGEPSKKRPTIGVALSGGAAHGFAHIGVLKVLHEAGIPIDHLVGTSAGSVIGAAYASGTSFEEMTEVCSTMHWRDIAKLTLSKRGLASIHHSQRVLDRLIKVETFEQLQPRFYAVTTDIRTGEIIVLSRGNLKTAVQASCAIPGLFIPVEIQGRFLVDGGLAANLPVLPLRQLGVDKIIAVNVSTRPDPRHPPQNFFQIVLQSMFIMGNAAMRSARENAHVMIEPVVHDFAWDDFEHCHEIARAGELAMRQFLPKIQAWLPASKRSVWGWVRSVFSPVPGA
ncbi:MAG: patatin-like phospholipase family protein [Acidobacteriia bacterium]|nr:patatin-like phospholipase family protein [Terriglobia bacterium]